jgi:integrase/recombinase XerD
VAIVRVEPLFDLVLDGLTSPKSKAVYRTALVRFYHWYTVMGSPGWSKKLVQEYRQALIDSGLAPRSINTHLSAIRKLALEASDNGYLDPAVGAAISRVPGVKVLGKRLGHWLTQDEAQDLLDTPDVLTVRGRRDRAMLAVMVGAGLRRAEVVALTVEHLQLREGRWVIVDLVGKGGRVRAIPVPLRAKEALDAVGVESGLYFRRVLRGDHMTDDPLTARGVYHVAAEYGVKPHDLRRTYAQLCHRGGADLRQLSLSLGHTSTRTTELYLSTEQDFRDAPCDHIGLEV